MVTTTCNVIYSVYHIEDYINVILIQSNISLKYRYAIHLGTWLSFGQEGTQGAKGDSTYRTTKLKSLSELRISEYFFEARTMRGMLTEIRVRILKSWFTRSAITGFPAANITEYTAITPKGINTPNNQRKRLKKQASTKHTPMLISINHNMK